MKLFQREQRSLFGEILDWMLTPLLLLWPVSLGLTWYVAQGVAGKPFDRALEYNVVALADLVSVSQNRVRFNLTQPAHQLLHADIDDTVFYQVVGVNGEHISGDRDLPAPKEEDSPEAGVVRLRQDAVHGIDIKVAYTWVRVAVPESRLVLVQVAETLEKRSVLATEITKGVMLPQFVILPLAVLLVWLALVQALKPLTRLENLIRARKPDDMSPLNAQDVPIEIAPLVLSVNDLFMRLKDSIATQKRFLADAAHQLKTPLAGLRMQADLAQREGAGADELKQSLGQIGRASIRATHTVNQLLALARAESSGASMSLQPCNLAQLTMEVTQECLARAMDKHLDLGYEGALPADSGVVIPGNPTLLKELIRNLIDNAISYTPSDTEPPGIITARVLVDPFGKVALLQVEDSGPGIAPSEQELIFQPFYRSLGTEVDGTGLGLPIVLEIAMQHNATVSVEDTRPGASSPGARFIVRFEAEARSASVSD